MIKINEPSKELIQIYKEEVIPKIKEKLEKEEKNSTYANIVKQVEKNLEEIVIGNINCILEKYNEIQIMFPMEFKEIGKNKILSKEQKQCKEFFEKIFDYKEIIQNNTDFSYTISNMLNVSVCPYCNRIYTTTCQSKNGKVRPQFDHFFAKSKYPILALSIYNLVPSCSICNSRKGTREFSIEKNMYPYQEGLNKDKYFSYKLAKEGNYQIITLKNNAKMNNNDKALMIEDIYQKAHSNEINNLIKKREIYSEIYIKEINQIKGIRKITKEELKYFLGYTSEGELINVSLGKLKNDIINEIV